ncbi:hypothetical protein TMEC54S_03234 [Thauera mechernichensis]
MRRSNADLDSFFTTTHPTEPFFVKNLENVQGDERDVIFISIGYGRNESGRVAKEFGPLNLDGGERRLNVLISRAKMAMEVFCNFTAGDLELNENARHGIRALKHFLQFAETGQLDIPIETGRQADSPFELEVKHALEERGYALQPQVGTAGYFIDLAVKDPEKPGRYILAIECDGASYHSARSARDRDRLRQGVLESLGWKFHRIWSTDWFRNPQKEVERAIAAIERAKSDFDAPIQPKSAAEPIAVIHRSAVEEVTEAGFKGVPYKKAELPVWTSPLQLHEVSESILSKYIEMVAKDEAPVHESNVCKRLLTAFNLRRAGQRIVERVSASIQHGHRQGAFFYQERFIYLDGTMPAKVRNRSSLEAAEKKIELVAPEEIDAAIKEIVSMGFSIGIEDAISAVLVMLGFGRATSNIAATVNSRIEALVALQQLQIDGQKLTIPASQDSPSASSRSEFRKENI